ncbi:MAG: sensor histidine kinase [Pseudomonadota bacterium]
MAETFRLKEYFFPRVLPIMIIFVLIFSTIPPLLYFYLSVEGTRSKGDILAGEVANFLRREVYASPVLWKYDTFKLITHIQGFSIQPHLVGILIEDEHGAIVNVRDEAQLEHYDGPFITWSMIPLKIDNKLYGKVFVGFDSSEIRNSAFLLFIPFLVVGLVLAGGIYVYSRRLIGRAQDNMDSLFAQINETKEELDFLNKNLEKQVGDKTMELKAAYEKLKAGKEQLARLSARSIMLQEEEKKSIARELHDSLGQTMTAIRIDIELLGKRDLDAGERQRLMKRSAGLIDEAINELRQVVELMRPPILDYAGLKSALESVVGKFEERAGARVSVSIEVGEGSIPPAVEIACYRIVQEALTNVMKHASAKSVDIAIAMAGSMMHIQVRDDGKGFDVKAAEKKEGRGMAGIRERAELLGGSAAWDTGPGRGCGLEVDLPFEAGAE